LDSDRKIISGERDSQQRNQIIALKILELHKMKTNKQRCDGDAYSKTSKLLAASSGTHGPQIISAFIHDHDFAP